jgi:RHS repeat-associated protein
MRRLILVPQARTGSFLLIGHPVRLRLSLEDSCRSVYNYYRDLDPATGRYVESDPLGVRAGANTYSYVNEDSLESVDPLGLCKVEIRFNPAPGLGRLGLYHAYVVTTDPNGSQRYFRGGPSVQPNLDSWILGNIKAAYGDYVPGVRDWKAKPAASMTVRQDKESCGCENAEFKSILDAINAAQIPYYPERTNSNSVIGTMLRDLGYSIGPLPVWAPAFNNNLNYRP